MSVAGESKESRLLETDATPVGVVLSRLEGVVRTSNGWTAHCPAHDDEHASLSVSVGENGIVLVKCHAGCSFEQIVRATGLPVTCFFSSASSSVANSKSNLGTIDAIYEYRDESGSVLYEVVRYRDPKGFRQRQPDGNGGHIWNLNGVRRVPYRLPDLLAAQRGSTIYIAEGEKDCDRLRDLELLATTNPQGARKWSKLDPEVVRIAFADQHVVLIPDNDTAGREHVEDVARSLAKIASNIRIVDLPGLPPKGDVSDWLNAGGTKESLIELASAAPSWSAAQPTVNLLPVPMSKADASSHEMVHLTDLGNAQRMAAAHGHDLRHCHPRKKWLVWNGQRWNWDDSGEPERRAKATIREMYGEGAEAVDEIKNAIGEVEQ